jgi:hypothetical protein
MSQAPEDSPNELSPAANVRRLNRVPLLIAGLLLSVLLAAVATAIMHGSPRLPASPRKNRSPSPHPFS